MSANTNLQFYNNGQINFETDIYDKSISIGSANGTTEGFELQYDRLTSTKTFRMNALGFNWTDGINSFTTGLERLCSTETALQAVVLPPNATTLEINKTLEMNDQLGNTGSIGLNGVNMEITATGDLILNPTGSIETAGKKINMVGGEIDQVGKVVGKNNTDIELDARGTGDVLIKTATVTRLGISDTGSWTINGGVGSSGQVLASGGAGVSPSWTTFTPTPQVESIGGTTAISPSTEITLLTGTTHSLASGTIVGQRKTIVNNNPNAFELVLNSSSTTLTGNINIRALKYDPVLNRMYVGGEFSTIGGVANTSRIAYYDFGTSTWSAMGTGCNSDVNNIQISGNKVFVSGLFALAGGVANTNNIAYWDTGTNSWNAMGTGVITNPNFSSKMIILGTNLYWFGSFTLVNGIANTVRVARWDITGATWNAMGTGMASGSVNDATIDGTSIWFSGNFTGAGGIANTTYLARWDTIGSTWNGYGANQVNSTISLVKLVSAGNIFISGNFNLIGTTTYYFSALMNTSTNAFSVYGATNSGTLNVGFIDTDNTLWYLGNYTTLSNASNVDYPQFYYPQAYGMSFFDTTLNKFCPMFSVGQGGFICMERTNVAGEYWVGGGSILVDGFTLSGMNGLLKFQKNNLIRVNSNLNFNGLTNRNSFGLVYKGQSVSLLNVDNTKWAVTNTSFTQSAGNGGAPAVIFY